MFWCIDLCSTCRGRVDVVVQCANKIWDVHLDTNINAAGGVVTTWDNRDRVLAGNIVSQIIKQII